MLSNQIIEYRELHPEAKAKEIAEAVGTSPAYVYQTLSPKKKVKKQLKPVAPTEGQKTLRQEINCLNEKIEDLNYEIKQMGHLLDEYRDKVRELKLHHGGLEYIISYLESRLGIKENDGTTV